MLILFDKTVLYICCLVRVQVFYAFIAAMDNKGYNREKASQRTLTMFVGVVALRYQQHATVVWC